MPKPFKTTVTVEGNQHEVEVTPPNGYYDQEEVAESFVPKDSVESTIRQRVERAKRDARSSLLDDEDFVQEVASKHGLQKSDGEPPDLDERLKAARQEWERQNLKPLEQRLEEKEKRERDLLRSKLQSDILAAASGKVEDPLLKSGPGGTPRIVGLLGGDFAWDPDHGHFAVVEGFDDEGNPRFKYSGNPKESGSPHMSVQEFVDQWVEDKENAHFVKRTRQSGPNLGEPGGGTGKNVVLTPEQASDHTTYAKAQEQAEKQGGHVVVQGEAPLVAGQPSE